MPRSLIGQSRTLAGTRTLAGNRLPQSLLAGLVSYYKFDENTGTVANDSVGINTGHWSGTGDSWTTGKINSGISTNGAGGIDCGNDASIQLTSAFTYAFWVKMTSLNAFSQFLGKDSGGTRGTGIYIHSSGKPYIVVHIGGNEYNNYDGTNTTLPTGSWHFIVATLDTSHKLKYYYDTKQETATVSLSGNVNNGSSNFYISSGFNGVIDEVGVWNRTLTVPEIQTLYNSNTGYQYPFAVNRTLVV